jgi:hypothetical protein
MNSQAKIAYRLYPDPIPVAWPNPCFDFQESDFTEYAVYHIVRTRRGMRHAGAQIGTFWKLLAA